MKSEEVSMLLVQNKVFLWLYILFVWGFVWVLLLLLFCFYAQIKSSVVHKHMCLLFFFCSLSTKKKKKKAWEREKGIYLCLCVYVVCVCVCFKLKLNEHSKFSNVFWRYQITYLFLESPEQMRDILSLLIRGYRDVSEVKSIDWFCEDMSFIISIHLVAHKLV